MSWRVQAGAFTIFAALFLAATVCFGLQAGVYLLVANYWYAVPSLCYALTTGGLSAIYGLFAWQNWRLNRLDLGENPEESL